MTAYQCYKLDRENIRRYAATGYRDNLDICLLPSATAVELKLMERTKGVTATEDETKSSITRNLPSDYLTLACVGDDGSQLLENTLCETDGGGCNAPSNEGHNSKHSTVIHAWKPEAQQTDESEPFMPFHKRIFSIRIDEDPSSTGVGHATHSENQTSLDQTAKCIEDDRSTGLEVGAAAVCHVNQSGSLEWVRQFEPMISRWTNQKPGAPIK